MELHVEFFLYHIFTTCFSNRSCQCWWSWDLLWYHNPCEVHCGSYVVTPDMCKCKCDTSKILCTFLVWLLELLCQAVITGLLASVIHLRSKQLDCTQFLHGINTLVLALIAYNDIFDKNGSSLSIAGGNILWINGRF